MDYSIVDKLIDGALSIEKGELVPKEAEIFGQNVHVYNVGVENTWEFA